MPSAAPSAGDFVQNRCSQQSCVSRPPAAPARVREPVRVGPFDAFTKSLVDRFLNAIPADWRPTRPYQIAFPKRRATEGFLTLARLSAPQQWQAEIAAYSASDFESKIVGRYRLPTGPIKPQKRRRIHDCPLVGRRK